MHPTDIDPKRLEDETFVENVEYHIVIDSTNLRARQCAGRKEFRTPALFVAEEQTAGRGRRDHRWWTGRGNLAFSLLLKNDQIPPSAVSAPPPPLLTALAVVETIAPHIAPRRAGLHWPNDVYIEDRKICGILVEVLADGGAIVGVGLNVNARLEEAPAELRDTATTLCELTGHRFDRTELLIELISRLASTLETAADARAEFTAQINRHCLQKGRMLTVESGDRQITGRCAGIAGDGALLLETESERLELRSGTVIAVQ